MKIKTAKQIIDEYLENVDVVPSSKNSPDFIPLSDFEKARKIGIAMSEKEITKAFNEGDEEERHYWLGYEDALKDLKVEK